MRSWLTNPFTARTGSRTRRDRRGSARKSGGFATAPDAHSRASFATMNTSVRDGKSFCSRTASRCSGGDAAAKPTRGLSQTAARRISFGPRGTLSRGNRRATEIRLLGRQSARSRLWQWLFEFGLRECRDDATHRTDVMIQRAGPAHLLEKMNRRVSTLHAPLSHGASGPSLLGPRLAQQ
jgi:hypothetical protein